MNSVQYRMARGGLNWSTRQIAEAADVSRTTLQQYQTGHSIPEAEARRVQAAFEKLGVVFLDENGEGPSVRLRKAGGDSDLQNTRALATDALESMDGAIREDREKAPIRQIRGSLDRVGHHMAHRHD